MKHYYNTSSIYCYCKNSNLLVIKQIKFQVKKKTYPPIENETNLQACKYPIFRSFSSKFNSRMLL